MLNIVILSKFQLKKFKEYKLALILIIAVVFASFSQNSIGIGTDTPEPSALLEVRSTNKGFLLPRMDKTQMDEIISPARGLMAYCTNCIPKGVYVYDGEEFRQLQFLKKKIETLNIADVQTSIGSSSFDINPSLIPEEATVDYSLVAPRIEGVSITEGTTTVNIATSVTDGNYTITVKATGKGKYTGEVDTDFTLTLQPN